MTAPDPITLTHRMTFTNLIPFEWECSCGERGTDNWFAHAVKVAHDATEALRHLRAMAQDALFADATRSGDTRDLQRVCEEVIRLTGGEK